MTLIYYDESNKRMKGYYDGHPDQKYGHTTFSQHGEDLLVVNLFDQIGIQNPSYLDLGAHHPVNISNTKLLYDRGSRGVNIEANPHLIDAFYKQRPDDKNINIGVTPLKEQIQARFFMYDDNSGRNTFSIEEISYVREREAKEGRKISKSTEIICKPLSQIIDDYCDRKFPDFLNCDLEGLDFGVLSSFDFFGPRGRPLVICVEVREKLKMASMLSASEYRLVCKMGENMIYVYKYAEGKISKRNS